eukprot:Skav234401  [mRNA]  locus=scaffold873:237976:242812:- [translate_table: standard]
MDEKQINTRYPLCISECPSTWGSEIDCYIGNNTFDLLPTYKTRAVDGVCEPIEGTAGNLIYREIYLFYLYHRPWTFWRTLMHRAYPMVAATAIGTLVAAVVYVMFVARFVREIIWIGSLMRLVPSDLREVLEAVAFAAHAAGVLHPGLPRLCVGVRVVHGCHVHGWHGQPKLQLRWEGLAPEVGSIVYVVFMMIWHLGIVHQISNLALIYTAQTWFFQGGMSSPQESEPSIARGYWIALRYHLGTCIYAGLVILLISPIRFPLKILTGLMQMRQNPLGIVLWVCFGWVQDCFYNNLEGISSHSIYDTRPLGPF